MSSAVVSGIVIAVFFSVSIASGQTEKGKPPRPAESRPTSAPTLPRPVLAISSAGEKVTKELLAEAVVVELAHRTDDERARNCRLQEGLASCEVADHWRIVLDRRTAFASGINPKFADALRERALNAEKKPLQPRDPPTSRPIVFGFDARASCAAAATILEEAALARFFNFHFLVRTGADAKTATAIRCDLPVYPQRGPVGEMYRVSAIYDAPLDRLKREFMKVGDKYPTPVPDGPEGDETLLKTLREWAVKNAAGAEPILRVASDTSLAWQFKIDLISVGRIAGFKKIEFEYLMPKNPR